MLLLIDAGNTRIKWAVPEDVEVAPHTSPRWLHMDSVSHADIQHLSFAWKPLSIHRILISNVAGAGIKEKLSQMLEQSFPGIDVIWFSSSAYCAGLQNQYKNPQQLGCDRFASAIAAHYLYPQRALIVATCGTATTIDAVTADGQFTGGMILPGLKLMAESLARNTAQLPQVAESIQVNQPFADNTDQAIVSGCIHAQAGAISLACRAQEKQFAVSPVCLISGGAAPYLLPHLDYTAVHIPNLVLTGLFVVAQSSPY